MRRRDVIKAAMLAGAAAPFGPAAVLAQAAVTPKRGGALTVALYPEPPNLFSGNSAINATIFVGTKVFDSLITNDFKFNMVPALAREWDVSPDGLTWKFILRDGVKWHDGKDFSSADVAYTMMEVWKKLHPRGINSFRNIDAAETPDAHTVIFKLRAPIPYMNNALSSYDATIMPKHIFDGTDVLNNPAIMKPVGTGPFRFKEWVRGSYIVCERSPDYWDKPKPYVDRLIFRIVPDAAGRSAALEAQEILSAGPNPVPDIDLDRLAKLPYLNVTAHGSEAFNAMIYLQFNLKHPIFGKVEVRRAIAHAIDRDFILKNILYGRGSVATGCVSPNQKQAYTPDVTQYPYDPAIAEKLLDQAGYPRGADGSRFATTLDAYTIFEKYIRTGEYLREALNKIGVKTMLRTEEPAAWNRRIFTNYDYELTTLTPTLLADPTIGMQRFFYTKAIKQGMPWVNASRYSNPKVDELFDICQVEQDKEKRGKAWHEIQQILQKDLPVYALVNDDQNIIVNKQVHDMLVSPEAMFETFSGVWLES